MRPGYRPDLLLTESLRLWVGAHPRWRRRPELDDEIEVGADQGDDRARHEQHVDRVEPRQGGADELRAGAEEVGEVGADDRARRGDVHGDDRRPVGALVERQQVAGQAHHQGEDQEHDADHPVQLPGVLVGAEEERSRHVEEDQDDHQRGAPLVEAADELAEEDVVGQVRDRVVGLGRRGHVVHRQEDAGQRLHREDEQRRRAERVEPVRALRDLAEQHPGQERARSGALVDPADDVDRHFLRLLEQLLATRRAGRAPLPPFGVGAVGALTLAGLARLAQRGWYGQLRHQLGGGAVVGRGG